MLQSNQEGEIGRRGQAPEESPSVERAASPRQPHSREARAPVPCFLQALFELLIGPKERSLIKSVGKETLQRPTPACAVWES